MFSIEDGTNVDQSATSHVHRAKFTLPGNARNSLALNLSKFMLVLCLLAFNTYWYWREHRSLPDYDTVTQWIQGEH